MANLNQHGVISVSADVSEALAFFDGLNVNKQAIRKNLMRVTGSGAVNAARRGVSNTLHNRTNKLKRGIRFVYGFKYDYVKLYSNADSGKPTSKDGRNARYGFMLAHGYTIRDQNEETLTFMIGGRWIRKHQITVPPKDWLEPSVLRYSQSAELDQRLDKEFQRQVNYWEKKITGSNL